MPWCPKCRTEYVEGVKKCSDCQSDLVEKKIDLIKEEYDKEVFLTTAADTFEANIIESLLSSYGIPVLKKHKSMGEYVAIFTGNSNFGIDIFVPSRALTYAKSILDAPNDFPDE